MIEYSGTITEVLGDMGLEESVLEGEQRRQFLALQQKICGSDLETKLAILPDYVEYILKPAMIGQM